jgi:hypothetical protein
MNWLDHQAKRTFLTLAATVESRIDPAILAPDADSHYPLAHAR